MTNFLVLNEVNRTLRVYIESTCSKVNGKVAKDVPETLIEV